MEPACSPSFSAFALHESSPEYEGTHSSHCIKNLVKAGLFSFWIVCFSLALIVVSVALAMDWLKTKEWNPQKRSFIALIIACSVQLIRFSFFLSGAKSRGIYSIFFVSEWITFSNFLLFIRDSFKATTLIHHPGEVKVGSVLHQFDLYLGFGMTYCFLGFFITKTLGPMIFFDNPQILNWFYVFSYCHFGILSIGSYFFFAFFSRRLQAAILPALEFSQQSPKLRRFVDKLSKFQALYGNGLPGNLFLVVVPVWMGVSSTPSNPLGMQYFFYFDICFWTSVQFFCVVFYTWFMEKRYYELRGSSEEKGNSQSNSLSTSQPTSQPRSPSRSHDEKEKASFSNRGTETGTELEVVVTFPSTPINDLDPLPEH